MIIEFDSFRIDIAKAELRLGESEIQLEPKAFELICMLVENRDRMVSKDELVQQIWHGRFTADSSISTVVKMARQALDDDGTKQKYIRTIRGRGFRFVGIVNQPPAPETQPIHDVSDTKTVELPGSEFPSGRPTIAVVPFKLLNPSEYYATIADAIPAELIASLSRLRWLKVVARGSTFRFRDDVLDMATINSALGAQYCLSGIVEIFGSEMTVGIELSDTRTQETIWSERLSGKIDDVHQTRETIVSSVLTALELRIPLHESDKARLKSPESLDAWGLYHLGLRHIFRFSQNDTGIAAVHFNRAIDLDPGFARAHAGLSYAHFQNAFQRFTSDLDKEQKLARHYAEESMALDPLDPFVNLALGRSQWLEGNFDSSISWIERSIELNPNYAYGLYNHSLLNAILCNGERGESSAAKAMSLSPLDPVRSSMLAIRAMNCFLMGDHDNALQWAKHAVQDSGKHAFVYAISAIVFAHAGDQIAAKKCVAEIHDVNPTFQQEDFFKRFDFVNSDQSQDIRQLLKTTGL